MSNPASSEKIRAIAFDFGGVIELFGGGNILVGLSTLLGIPLPELREVYFKNNHLANVENMRWEEMILKVISHFDSSKETAEKVKSYILADALNRRINDELLGWFPALRKQGLKIALLSNATTELREKLQEKGLHDAFDAIVISGEIGFQKPHKEAFDALFKELGVMPHELVFVDDGAPSLAKAAEIGYTPILFRDNAQLKAELAGLGISVE